MNVRTINPSILACSQLAMAAFLASPTAIAQVRASVPYHSAVAKTSSPAFGQAADASFSSEKSNEDLTHITVGRSLFINTHNRLARVYVTNPEVLDSYTANPNQVVVTAKKAGVSNLILWDESGVSKTYLVSADLSVEMLQRSVKEAFPLEKISVEGNETRAVLSGTVSSEAIAEAAVKLANQYAKEVSSALLVNSSKARQVRLQVRIVEVDRSKQNSYGFNFFSAGGNNLASTSTSQFPSTLNVQTTAGSGGSSVGGKSVTLGNPLNFSIYSSKLNVGATLQMLETLQVLQILAQPEITTLSGQKANFLAGGEFPFPVVQGTATGTAISIQFRPYGVKLEFLPIVNVDGSVEMHVAPEVSALDYTNAVSIAGYTIPALSTRKADTQVVVQSGQTFAISGLLDKRTTDAFSKTPGIASVPVLGQLFKSKNGNRSNTELVVIVTPTILDPVTGAAPEEPKQVIPFLEPKSFDKELPSGVVKK